MRLRQCGAMSLPPSRSSRKVDELGSGFSDPVRSDQPRHPSHSMDEAARDYSLTHDSELTATRGFQPQSADTNTRSLAPQLSPRVQPNEPARNSLAEHCASADHCHDRNSRRVDQMALIIETPGLHSVPGDPVQCCGTKGHAAFLAYIDVFRVLMLISARALSCAR